MAFSVSYLIVTAITFGTFVSGNRIWRHIRVIVHSRLPLISETNFIDLTEIKSKFQSDVLVEVPSSRTIGNLITKLFHGVKIKPGRCKDNWAKSTQRYFQLF
jgi:hypothetical protein